MPMPLQLTAADMAREAKLTEKTFRARMRAASFTWHRSGDSWTVEKDSKQHLEVMAVLVAGTKSKAAGAGARVNAGSKGREHSDEAYVIRICDRLLGETALRGHRFSWLVGDGTRPTALPVDAYYPEHRLVIEVHERQHGEAVPHFDKPDRMTVSGVHRGEQRTLYDQRRRLLIPTNGLKLLEIRVDELAHDQRKKLLRLDKPDEAVIREKLCLIGATTPDHT